MTVVLPRHPIETSSAAEKRVHALLATLKGPWTILHSVSWQSPDRRHNDGEADFVIMHPDHGLLVLEVKGGVIRVEDGVWYSRDRHGEEHRVKNPFEQAVASKHALVAFLRSRIDSKFLPAGHAVALPDVVAPELGPAAPAAITWDREALKHPTEAVAATVAHYELTGDLAPPTIERIASLLLPSVTLKPLLRDEIATADASLTKLTTQQIEVLEGLRRNRRAVIYGGAGTGKSVLAIHRSLRLAEQGFEVLLTCFNQPLAAELARQTEHEPRVRVRTFHKLSSEESRRAGLRSEGTGSTWWDRELPGQLPTAAASNKTSFDAIVVDEGQDFRPDWWVALQLLLRDPDNGPFYVFADTQQAIYLAGWEPPFDGTTWDLTINCRNTRQISGAVASVFSESATSLGVDGPDPVFREVTSFAAIGDALRKSLHNLVSVEGIAPHDITVLSTSKAVVDICRARKFGNIVMGSPGPGRIAVETVHRFKGLESPAVVLIAPPGDFIDPGLMYVGLSRGRAYLEVIAEAAVGARLGLEAA